MGVYASRCAQAVAAAFDCEVVAAEGASARGNIVLRAPIAHTLGAGRGAAFKRWAWSQRQRRFSGRLLYSPTHHSLPRADSQIITIHDLIALRFRRQHPLQYLYYRYRLPLELSRCAAVFTVSETSRQDIHAHFGLPLDRIRIVPNGVDRGIFHPAPEKSRQPFLLVVGASYSHKNVHELIANAETWSKRYELVVASCRGAYRETLESLVNAAGLQARVRLIEYVPLAELVHLYQTCAALVSPSRWEGFGIPPVEALACGAPVIVSDIPAHREVLGSRATFVRLGNSADWGRAFEALGESDPGTQIDQLPPDAFRWEDSGCALVSALLATEPCLARYAKIQVENSMACRSAS